MVVKEFSDQGRQHFNLYVEVLLQARDGAPPPSDAKWSRPDTEKDGAGLSLLLVGGSRGPDCYFSELL